MPSNHDVNTRLQRYFLSRGVVQSRYENHCIREITREWRLSGRAIGQLVRESGLFHGQRERRPRSAFGLALPTQQNALASLLARVAGVLAGMLQHGAACVRGDLHALVQLELREVPQAINDHIARALREERMLLEFNPYHVASGEHGGEFTSGGGGGGGGESDEAVKAQAAEIVGAEGNQSSLGNATMRAVLAKVTTPLSSTIAQANQLAGVISRTAILWADSAKSVTSVTLEHAAARLWGGQVWHGRPTTLRGSLAQWSQRGATDGAVFPIFLQYAALQYAVTQRVLAQEGVQTVTLYRGINLRGEQKTAMDHAAEGGASTPVTLNALSSFSTSRKVAASFGNVLLEVQVPASQIFSSYKVGLGKANEKEVLVLGDKQTFNAQVRVGGGRSAHIVMDARADLLEATSAKPKPLHLDREEGNRQWLFGVSIDSPLQEAPEDEFPSLFPPQVPSLVPTFSSIPVGQISELFTTPLGGANYATSFGDLVQTLLTRLRNTLMSGLLQGSGIGKVSQGVQGVLGNARWQAERIVRSEFGRVANQAALAQFDANRDVVKSVQWVATLDGRTCIVQGLAKVKTAKGWRAIRDVRPGDMVLTHADTFAVVQQVTKRAYVGPVVRLKIQNSGAPGHGRVSMTADHLVWARQFGQWEWTPAGRLKRGDEVLAPGQLCKGSGCSMVVPEWRRLCATCVVRRRNAVSWTPEARARLSQQMKGRPMPPAAAAAFKHYRESPAWQQKRQQTRSRTIRRQWKDPVWRARQVQRLQQQGIKKGWHLLDPARAELVWRAARLAVAKHRNGQTYAEVKLAWLLRKLGIIFHQQHYMPAEGRRHWVDFYLPQQNLVIEVDGAHFHTDEMADRLREGRLQRVYGCGIIRFTDIEIKKSLDVRVIPQLNRIRAGCTVAVKITGVFKKTLKPRLSSGAGHTVYDLSVDGPHHSFFVNGLAVHNCLQCGNLDGKTWEDASRAPVPVRSTHPNCRCRIVPVLKSAQALGLPPSTRASMTGQVPETVTYRDWFADQSAGLQQEILGPTRYRLYSRGAVSLPDFVSARGIRSVQSVLRSLE